MCCVIGFVGSCAGREQVLTGLARLEYRGYDSAGFACIQADTHLVSSKVVGGVESLAQQIRMQNLNGSIAIGHTRWSTHGVVSVENAHPVFDCHEQCAVVHNGIIAHEKQLREQLIEQGHLFHSQTDSELIAHLFEEYLPHYQNAPQELLRAVVSQLDGAFAFVALLKGMPDILFLARKRSPLCIGRGADGFFIVSDPIACAGYAHAIVFVPDESYAVVTRDAYTIFSMQTGQQQPVCEQPLELAWNETGKQGYEHYMLKEIYEQRDVIQTIATRSPLEIEQFLSSPEGTALKDADELFFIGCGTSLHAAYTAAIYFETLCHLPVRVFSATELRDRLHTSSRKKMFCCALSQSGETADTLEAMRSLQQHDIPVLAIINRPFSSMSREADAYLLLHAGEEIAVASTKTFTAHLSVLYELAQQVANHRTLRTQEALSTARQNLLTAAEALHEGIVRHKVYIDQIVAPQLAQHKHAIFIGRGMGYCMAQESALKVKELAYIFAEAYYAGELKHGPLALIEAGLPLLVCSTLEQEPYERLVSNAQEARARKAWIIACAFEGQEELIAAADVALILPRIADPLLAPLVMSGLLQYLVYRVAYCLQLPIDKPRNLAKSVTVE